MFTCVGGQVTLYDLIPRSAMGFPSSAVDTFDRGLCFCVL